MSSRINGQTTTAKLSHATPRHHSRAVNGPFCDVSQDTTMTFDASFFLTGAALVIGGVVWLVRLEGRINAADRHVEDVIVGLGAQFTEIIRRLDRIERRQDKVGDIDP